MPSSQVPDQYIAFFAADLHRRPDSSSLFNEIGFHIARGINSRNLRTPESVLSSAGDLVRRCCVGVRAEPEFRRSVLDGEVGGRDIGDEVEWGSGVVGEGDVFVDWLA